MENLTAIISTPCTVDSMVETVWKSVRSHADKLATIVWQAETLQTGILLVSLQIAEAMPQTPS